MGALFPGCFLSLDFRHKSFPIIGLCSVRSLFRADERWHCGILGIFGPPDRPSRIASLFKTGDSGASVLQSFTIFASRAEDFSHRPYYFKNQIPRRNYVAFRLRGTKSNRDAVGAVVRLHCGNEVMTRAVPPAGGYLAQSSRTVHFGLGERRKIDRVEIRWPSGLLQTIESPLINTAHQVTESAR